MTTPALRIVVADVNALLREGIASLLEDAGHDIVGRSGDADDLLLKVRSYRPTVAVIDVRMPPGNADDGLVAAAEIAVLNRKFPSSSCRSTSSLRTCSNSSATTPQVWGISSRTGYATCANSSTRSNGSRPAERHST